MIPRYITIDHVLKEYPNAVRINQAFVGVKKKLVVYFQDIISTHTVCAYYTGSSSVSSGIVCLAAVRYTTRTPLWWRKMAQVQLVLYRCCF